MLTRAQRDLIRRERDRIVRAELAFQDELTGRKTQGPKHEVRADANPDGAPSWPPLCVFSRERRPGVKATLDEAVVTDDRVAAQAAKYGLAVAQLNAQGGGFPLPSILNQHKEDR